MAGKRQINARVSDEIFASIVQGANRVGESPGTYLRLIGELWFARGAPPVSPSDEASVNARKRTSENLRAARAVGNKVVSGRPVRRGRQTP